MLMFTNLICESVNNHLHLDLSESLAATHSLEYETRFVIYKSVLNYRLFRHNHKVFNNDTKKMFANKFHSILLIGLAVLFGVVLGLRTVNNNKSKECNSKKVDVCSNRLIMIGDRTFVYPENIQEMNKRCKEIKPMEKCLKDYIRKCLPNASSSTMAVLAYGISKTNKGYCSSKKRKLAFVAFGSCSNKIKKMLDAFIDKMNVEFHGIINYKNNKLKIPLVCCSYYNFKARVLDQVAKHCLVHSAEIESLLDGYANDILNLICGEYNEESDKCPSIIHEIPAYKGRLRSNSFIQPLAEIFESLK